MENTESTASSAGTLNSLAEEIARATTVTDVIDSFVRLCDLSTAEATRLVDVEADHLSTELFPAGSFPTGEVYDEDRYNEWVVRELRTTFEEAVEKLEEDVAGFLRVVFGRGDEATAEFNAAIFLGTKKRVGEAVSSVSIGYFCRDGIEHLKAYGAQWAEHPFTSPGWPQEEVYRVRRDDHGL